MAELIDLFLHVDRHLFELVADYGVWIYAILFLIVFAETGLVVTPFLPGDSLLFAAGALAATGALNLWLVAVLLLSAAIAGDAVNYAVGRSAGMRVIELARTDPRWVTLTSLDESTTLLESSADALEWLAFHVVWLGFECEILEPAELRATAADLSDRLRRAAALA